MSEPPSPPQERKKSSLATLKGLLPFLAPYKRQFLHGGRRARGRRRRHPRDSLRVQADDRPGLRGRRLEEASSTSTSTSSRSSAWRRARRRHRGALLHGVLAGRAGHGGHPQRRLPARRHAEPAVLRDHAERRGALAPHHGHDAHPGGGRHQHLDGAAQRAALRRRARDDVRDQRRSSRRSSSCCWSSVVLPIIVFGRRVRKLSRDSQDRIADASAMAGEILNAMPTVQAFTHERIEADRFGASVERAFATAIRRIRARSLLTVVAILLVFGAIVFVLWLGAHAVIQGTMTGGELGQFILYSVLVAGAVGALAETLGEAQRAAGATERLLELMSVRSPIQSPRAPASPAAAREERGGARAEGRDLQLPFAARSRRRSRTSSLAVEPGETVAVVGPSGAGKTTLFQLLLRFYDPQEGAIALDGVEIRLPRPARAARRDRHRAAGHRDLRRRRDGEHPLRARRRDATRRSSPPRGWPPRTSSSRSCRRATGRSSASAACGCPAGSASASRSPARCSRIRPCCCSTRRPAPSTPNPSAWCRARSRPPWPGARRSSSPTASPR